MELNRHTLICRARSNAESEPPLFNLIFVVVAALAYNCYSYLTTFGEKQ